MNRSGFHSHRQNCMTRWTGKGDSQQSSGEVVLRHGRIRGSIIHTGQDRIISPDRLTLAPQHRLLQHRYWRLRWGGGLRGHCGPVQRYPRTGPTRQDKTPPTLPKHSPHTTERISTDHQLTTLTQRLSKAHKISSTAEGAHNRTERSRQ